jgi:hypothetical protein
VVVLPKEAFNLRATRPSTSSSARRAGPASWSRRLLKGNSSRALTGVPFVHGSDEPHWILFPVHHVLPAHVVGALSQGILVIAIHARGLPEDGD